MAGVIMWLDGRQFGAVVVVMIMIMIMIMIMVMLVIVIVLVIMLIRGVDGIAHSVASVEVPVAK
jgi:hypothetical protein